MLCSPCNWMGIKLRLNFVFALQRALRVRLNAAVEYNSRMLPIRPVAHILPTGWHLANAWWENIQNFSFLFTPDWQLNAASSASKPAHIFPCGGASIRKYSRGCSVLWICTFKTKSDWNRGVLVVYLKWVQWAWSYMLHAGDWRWMWRVGVGLSWFNCEPGECRPRRTVIQLRWIHLCSVQCGLGKSFENKHDFCCCIWVTFKVIQLIRMQGSKDGRSFI